MTVLTVASSKDGPGKTTLCQCLPAAWPAHASSWCLMPTPHRPSHVGQQRLRGCTLRGDRQTGHRQPAEGANEPHPATRVRFVSDPTANALERQFLCGFGRTRVWGRVQRYIEAALCSSCHLWRLLHKTGRVRSVAQSAVRRWPRGCISAIAGIMQTATWRLLS